MIQPRYRQVFEGHDEGETMAENARVHWAIYKKDLEDRGLWTNTSAHISDRLVRAVVAYEHYYPLAVCEGPVKIAESSGQYANMLWYSVQKLSDQIMKLEKVLLLAPESCGETGKRPQGTKRVAADEFLDMQTRSNDAGC